MKNTTKVLVLMLIAGLMPLAAQTGGVSKPNESVCAFYTRIDHDVTDSNIKMADHLICMSEKGHLQIVARNKVHVARLEGTEADVTDLLEENIRFRAATVAIVLEAYHSGVR